MGSFPEILIFSSVLLGNDFLIISRRLGGWDPSGSSRYFLWIHLAVFGLIWLWYIIRKESRTRQLLWLLAGALGYLGLPLGFATYLYFRGRHLAKIETPANTSSSQMVASVQKNQTPPAALLVKKTFEPRKLIVPSDHPIVHAQNGNNPK